ncbi:dUTP diphosphatase [Candidatus Uhrbacteria bacterium]|nr:dUTP diphosphatase [Candidatus Uhrbacteria bacterium]
MHIPIQKLFSDAKIPVRASAGAVGYDVYAYHVIDKQTRASAGALPVTIPPHGSVLLGIGVAFVVPPEYDCQVRPRSGLASKHDIELSNSPGTVDPDYRGEASVLLRNRGDQPFVVEKGMRVAQLVFTKVELPAFTETDTLPPTVRDTGGFGSTGLFEVSVSEMHQLKRFRWWNSPALVASFVFLAWISIEYAREHPEHFPFAMGLALAATIPAVILILAMIRLSRTR